MVTTKPYRNTLRKMLHNKRFHGIVRTSQTMNQAFGNTKEKESSMNRVILTASLVSVICTLTTSAVDTTPETTLAVSKTREAQLFIDQNNLSKIDTWFSEWLSVVQQGDAKRASEVLLSKGTETPSDQAKTSFLKFCLQLSTFLLSNEAHGAELVARSRLSSECIVLYYMIHTERKGLLVTVPLKRVDNSWRHRGVKMSDAWEEQVDFLSKADKFVIGNTVFAHEND